MRVNNSLLGLQLYKELKKKLRSDKKKIIETADQIFRPASMDVDENLMESAREKLRRLSFEITGGGIAQDLFLNHITSNYANYILKKNNLDFMRSFPTVQNVFEDKPREAKILRNHVFENVRLIKNTTNKMANDVYTVVMSGIQAGRKRTDIVDDLRNIVDRTESGYKLIAKDQANKLYASITETRAEVNGWKFYKWITSRDVRVRSRSNSNGYSDHARLDGKIFKFGEPPQVVFKGKRAGERLPPGMDIGCRCTAQIMFEQESAFKKKEDGSYFLSVA